MDDESGISKEWVAQAWKRRVRHDLLKLRPREIKRAFHIMLLICEYTDPDGGNAFPSRETLANLAGCTKDYVTLAVRYFVSCGLIKRQRRPNASSVYVLLMPVGPVPWMEHLHILTTTRDRQRHARDKAERVAYVVDSERARGPEDARAGLPEDLARRSSGQPARQVFQDAPSASGRPARRSPDDWHAGLPDDWHAGALPSPSDAPAAHHQSPDHTSSGLSPQPQKRASAPALPWQPVRPLTSAEAGSHAAPLADGTDVELPGLDGDSLRQQIRREREERGGRPATRTRWPRSDGDVAASA